MLLYLKITQFRKKKEKNSFEHKLKHIVTDSVDNGNLQKLWVGSTSSLTIYATENKLTSLSLSSFIFKMGIII